MAYKDLKSMFITYTIPTIEIPKVEKKIIEFNRWDYLQDLITELPKYEPKYEPKKEPKYKLKKESKQESDVVSAYDNYVEENPWSVEGDTKMTKVKRVTNKDGYKQFQSQLDQYFINNPQDESYRDILTNIAAMESSFKQKATNKWSSALGYFQFLDGTRKQYNNMSREQFANDSQAQIKTAIAHLKELKDAVQRNINSDIITNSGLTPLQIMYGMWWRPKSMYNYLKTGSDDYSTSDGMNIKKILEKAS